MSHHLARSLYSIAIGLLGAGVCAAETISVPANGNFQAAINLARPGDVIALAAGATYVGNFVLPEKANPNGLMIVIRSAAAASVLPAAGQRIVPGVHASHLPKLRSPNAEPALQVAARARFWTLQHLEFLANDRGYGDIIALGSGDGAVQTSLSQVPSDLVIDRCYIHGDAAFGQKRGIALNSGKTAILNSHVSDIKAVGSETQAVAGWNGPGPYTIENNYLEGAGINFLLGGADPGIPKLVPTGVTFRRNHLAKPVSWRGPALKAPGDFRITSSTTSGSLRTTVYYTVIATGMAAMDTPIFSPPTQELQVKFKKRGSATLTWTAVPGATRYRVYRNSKPNLRTEYFETSSTSFLDAGSRPPNRGGIPWADSWTVKNLLELKNARNVTIDGNLIENNWTHAQSGFAVLFTVRNQDGGAPWATVDTVTFTNNILRHSPGGINVLGRDDEHTSGITRNITIRNNLFDDLGPAWGEWLPWLLLGDGADIVRVDHNTVLHSGPSLVLLYGAPTTNFVFTNNMGRMNEYGFIGDSRAPGNDSIGFYLPGAIFSKNIIVGASASSYPAANAACGTGGQTCYPGETSWQSQFVNFAAGNFRLKSTSPYAKAGTDAADLGANIDTVRTASGVMVLLTSSPLRVHAVP